MAGPLRRVSQNYQWTIKRARNDLHNSITSELQPGSASSNIDTNVSPWDSARLQWKFKTEYDELHEHLEHSFLIILGWWVTFKHLTKATAEHFITQPEQAFSNLFKQSTKLFSQVIFSLYLSLWGLLTTLFRHVVQRVAFHTQPFLSHSVNWFGANRKGEIGNPAIAVMSDPARLAALDEHLMGVLKDGMEMLKSAIHMGEGKPFHGSPSLDDVNKIPCTNEISGFIDLH
jgi:hypothetical protein